MRLSGARHGGGRWWRLAMVAVAAWTAAESASAAGRNVVLIVADDLGLQLGCYGDAAARTPRLDALAQSGTRFTHAFCTTASCSASRSVILTGLQNHANGQFGHQHSFHHFHTQSSVKSLPVLLAKAGYRTALCGKLHVQPEAVYTFEATLTDGVAGGIHNPVGMAERVRGFLAEKSERPFFLYFCPADPHRAGRGFANDKSYPGVTPVVFDAERSPPPSYLPNEPEVRREWAEYLQAVNRFDQGVGRLLDVLRETGHAEDTLVICLSDNGPPFPAAKTTLYEPGMRLPLIVRAPGQARGGQTCRAMVSWADLLPTVLEFAGAAGPGYPLHGKSFLKQVESPAADGWDECFASHTFHEITMYYPMRVLRTRTHKLILNVAHPLPFPFSSDLYASDTWQGVLRRADGRFGERTVKAYVQRPQFELYDLERDPGELVNLAGRPEQAERLREMQQRLKVWQTKTKDPWVVKYEYE